MLLGAIDIGTNSIHLIVVELDPQFGTSRTVLKAREMVRLGAGDSLERGVLGKKALARGVAAIARFAGAARDAGASDIRATATSAVREAENRDEFLAAVRLACGIDVEILADVEEARLIHLGVSRGFPLGDRLACVFDIGGGSTEFIVGDAQRPHYLRSVRMGSLRLYERYLRDEAGGDANLPALERHVRELMLPVAEQISDFPYDVLIATSGTVMGLATLDAARAEVAPQRMHGYVLRVERLRALQRTMLALSPADRKRLPGMNPRRSDIIAAGNAIVIGIMEALGRDELIVSERALREGIVVDYLERNIAVARQIGDERTRRFDSVHALGRRFGAFGAHEDRVASIALQLFDALASVHRFEPADRDVLFAAALVHDIGRAISASAHHKHGAYIVRNAGLPGWRLDEVELVAALVRYHRKSAPKPTHPEWLQATAAVKTRIVGLAAILRLAEGLDRRHLGLVTNVGVRHLPGGVTIVVEAAQDITPEIEGARFKAELFEKTYGLAVGFEAAIKPGFAGFGENEPDLRDLGAGSPTGG